MNKISERILLVLIIIFGAIILTMSSCTISCTVSDENEYTKTEERDSDSDERFQVVYSQGETKIVGKRRAVYILVDKQTGVKYLFVRDVYGAGLTKLEEVK